MILINPEKETQLLGFRVSQALCDSSAVGLDVAHVMVLTARLDRLHLLSRLHRWKAWTAPPGLALEKFP